MYDLRNQEAWDEVRNQLAGQILDEYLYRNQRFVSPPPRPAFGGAGVYRPPTPGMVGAPPAGVGYPAPAPAPGYFPPPAAPGYFPPPAAAMPGYYPPQQMQPWMQPQMQPWMQPTGTSAIADLIELAAPLIPILLPNPETPADQGKQATADNVIEHSAAIVNTGKKALLYMMVAKIAANVARRGRLV